MTRAQLFKFLDSDGLGILYPLDVSTGLRSLLSQAGQHDPDSPALPVELAFRVVLKFVAPERNFIERSEFKTFLRHLKWYATPQGVGSFAEVPAASKVVLRRTLSSSSLPRINSPFCTTSSSTGDLRIHERATFMSQQRDYAPKLKRVPSDRRVARVPHLVEYSAPVMGGDLGLRRWLGKLDLGL